MSAQEKDGSDHLSIFLQYLAKRKNYADRLPTLAELSKQLGISVASLREQLEVARALGFVEVKPRTGIHKIHYSFQNTIHQSLSYALALDPKHFQYYSDLRNHIEASYWEQATLKLVPDDVSYLNELVDAAEIKLHGHPIKIPQFEHREFHLTIFKRLENPFVTGILEAYWDLYEVAGLNLYTDYSYLEQVWQFHRRMVAAIEKGNAQEGRSLLLEHMNLLSHRPKVSIGQIYNGFE